VAAQIAAWTAAVVALTGLVSAIIVLVRQVAAAVGAIESHLDRQDVTQSEIAQGVNGNLKAARGEVIELKQHIASLESRLSAATRPDTADKP